MRMLRRDSWCCRCCRCGAAVTAVVLMLVASFVLLLVYVLSFEQTLLAFIPCDAYGELLGPPVRVWKGDGMGCAMYTSSCCRCCKLLLARGTCCLGVLPARNIMVDACAWYGR